MNGPMRVRLPAIVGLVMAALALPGCSGKEGPGDCGQGEAFNPHEGRCVQSVDPGTEVCNTWLSGGVDEGQGEVSCMARSDGKAWLDAGITTSDSYPVEVRDGAGRVVFSQQLQFPQSFELGGAEGTWTMSVDFDDVAGSGSVTLWG